MKSTRRRTNAIYAVFIGLLVIAAGNQAFAQGGTWETMAPMPTARSGAAGGVIDGRLYVAGGQGTANQKLTTLEVYNPADNTWATKAPMPTARNSVGGGVIDGKLYVVGGQGAADQKLATLEVYDPGNNTWTTKTPMRSPRSGPGVVAMDHKLYVAGGCVGWCAPVTAALEVYDPATDSWTTKTSMPTARGVADVAVMNGLFYVMGGCCGSVASQSTLMAKTVEAYSPATDTWAAKTQHLVGAGDTAGSMNGSIYLVKNNSAEVYDPATDTWASLSPMPTARQYAASGVINGKLYVAGGYNGGALATLEAFTPSVSASFDTVQKIYIGYYQRPADPGGLIYWTGRLNTSNGSLNEIINAFAASTESQDLYGTISSSNISDVVNGIYLALFNRNADEGGRNYYVDGFNAVRFTAATIMLNILYGATGGDDLLSVNNKVSAANLFTRAIDPELDGNNLQVTYAGDEDNIAGRNFLALNATSMKAPTQAETTAYIQTNIADPGDAILGQTSLYGISGTVSGTVASGVTITLTGAANRTATTDGGGYGFTALGNGNYTVTPSLAGYTVNPTSRSVAINNGDSTGNDFTTASEAAQVAAALQSTGPFGALMVEKSGEMLFPVVDRDGSGSASKITGALYINNVSGASALVYLGDDGKPTKTVIGDYILLFSNWSADGRTADIAKISTSTQYIEVFKGVNLNATATAIQRVSAATRGAGNRNTMSIGTTCFPACDSDAKNLSELLKIAGLGISLGTCLFPPTLLAAALPCAGVIVTTASLVVGNETWLGNLGGAETFLGATDVFQCTLAPVTGDPLPCVSTVLDFSSRTLNLLDNTADGNSGLIATANPFLSNPAQPSGVVQQGSGLPSCLERYQCTPGGAMSYEPCLEGGVRQCGAGCTWGSCVGTCGDGICDTAIAGENSTNCPNDCHTAPPCTFSYSGWSECQPNNTQTRTVISTGPAGCVGGTPVLSQSCTPPGCTFSYSDWSECQSNSTQTRTVISTGPAGCVGGTPVLSQSCVPLICANTISPPGNSFIYSGGSGTVSVTAQDGCAWTAASGAAWISVTSGGVGSGMGTVAYSVSANTGFSERSGTITIAGQAHTVTQAAAEANSCSDRASNCCTMIGGSQIQVIRVPTSCRHCPNDNTTYAGYAENGYYVCDCDACPSW